MMVPKPFEKDITVWRKWKDKVRTCSDDEEEGMTNVMDAVSRFEVSIARELSDVECAMNPMAPTE